MLQNSLEDLSDDIYRFLTGKNRDQKSLLIKRHTDNLQIHGDISFPNTLKSWHGHVNTSTMHESLLEHIGKSTEELIQESKQWKIPISRIKEDKGRIHIFLDRSKAIEIGLTQGLKNNDLVSNKVIEKTISVHCDPLCSDTDDLTSLRLKYLVHVIENLKTLAQNACSIFVSSKSSSKPPEGSHLVLCGTVLNAKTGVKETGITANEYIRIRQNEMTLVAQHKYGVRVSTDSKWRDFIAHLGESAVVFELLQIKPSSAVKINFNCSSSGSSKGAAFILYNCARLETIIKTYKEKVENGEYPPLPPFENADFSLLSQEDEWAIIFNFIMGFPALVDNCTDIGDVALEFRPHHICTFLSSMVRVFSQYYRRVRILTEPRKHLLPVIFARMHMLIILNETLKTCLKLLNIKSVSQM